MISKLRDKKIKNTNLTIIFDIKIVYFSIEQCYFDDKPVSLYLFFYLFFCLYLYLFLQLSAGTYIKKYSIQGMNVKITNQLVKDTAKQFSSNILNSGVQCGINKDITDPQGNRVFLKAGTEITDKIRIKLNNLKKEGIIGQEDAIAITEKC